MFYHVTSSSSSISISTPSNNRARFNHQRDPQYQLFSPIITTQHLAPFSLIIISGSYLTPKHRKNSHHRSDLRPSSNFSAISFILASQTATYQRSFQGHSTINVTPKTGSSFSPNDVTSLSAQYPQYIRHDYYLYSLADLYYDRTFLRIIDSQSQLEAQFLIIVATRI